MMKKISLLVLALVIGVAIYGCSTVSNSKTTTVESVTKIGTSEVTISGSLTYTDGNVDLNLNPVISLTGDAVVITPTNVRVRVGTSPLTITSATTLSVTVPASSSKKLDIIFVLDNTGSMGTAIEGSKNSIISFAQTLEAGGIDAKFGLVTFGDSAIHPTPLPPITAEGNFNDGNAHIRPIADIGTASALQNVLSTETYAEGGGDTPENPLDAVMYGYNHLSWRTGAQKIFIVITDSTAHQTGEASSDLNNKCTTTSTEVVNALFGRAVIYTVSPNYTGSQWPYLDIRHLADGLGEGVTTAESCTGGKWIVFNSSGFDLNNLGIATTLTKSYTVRFSTTFDSGTYYVWLEIDTDGDGIFDSNMLIKVGVSASSIDASSLKAFTVFSNEPVKPVSALGYEKPYIAPPNN